MALLLVAVLAAPGTGVADDLDVDLPAGVRQAQDGDYQAAVVTLDGVARRLAADPSRTTDLARATVYLAIAYHGLGQHQAAKTKFLEAVRVNPEIRLNTPEFSGPIREFFARARERQQTADAATENERSKTVSVLIGVGVLASVGVAVAAGVGGGGGAARDPSPATGTLAFRLSWNTADDLDLHVLEPGGFEVSFLSPRSPTSGAFTADVVCAAGTEAIHWTSTAPRGTYVVWAVNRPTCASARPVSFALTVSLGNSLVLSRSGTLAAASASERFSFVN